MLPTPFAEAVLDLIERIPPGRVMTYGDIAEYLGTGGPRTVGTVLSRFGGGVPWGTDGVAATLYPVRALLDAVFLPWLAHDLFVLVHLALAGAGAYWLARRWGAGWIQALSPLPALA